MYFVYGTLTPTSYKKCNLIYSLSNRCGNKFDLKSKIQVTDSDMEAFCEQCRNLVSGVYKTSCKTGENVEEMFSDIAKQLSSTNK